METAEVVEVEVAYARPDKQVILTLTVRGGTTARQAVELSGMLDRFPEIALERNRLGNFGSEVAPDHVLESGDRVEIYRPLEIDPREARRRLAEKGLTIGKNGQDKTS